MASVSQRPDGKWRARYRDEAGKEHARHFALKRDAQRWLDEVTASQVTGIYVDPGAGRITFRAWFEQWAALQVWEAGTLEAAERAVVGVPFADIPLGKITSSHVQGWVKELQDRGLASSTVRMRFNYVHMAFRAAVGERIARDPSQLAGRGAGSGVRLPREVKSTTRLRIPTVEQIAAIQLAARPDFRPFIGVCAFAGLRLGEAAGLRIGDIVASGGQGATLHVQRQVQGNTNGAVRVVAPKYQSQRWVPIPVELAEQLQRHATDPGTLGPEGWLFTPDAANLYNRQSAGYQWRSASERAGVRGFTLHSARHFYASSLIRAGCDVVTVQRALGHSTPTITLNTYSHLWPDAADRTRGAAADVMGQVARIADQVRTGGP